MVSLVSSTGNQLVSAPYIIHCEPENNLPQPC